MSNRQGGKSKLRNQDDFQQKSHSGFDDQKNPIGAPERWNSFANNITALFQVGKLVDPIEQANEALRVCIEGQMGNIIGQLFKAKLCKGMIILRQTLTDLNGQIFLERLSAQWRLFYVTIYPSLIAIFAGCVNELPKINVKKIALVAFRDHVLLNSSVAEQLQAALSPEQKLDIPPEIKQMLLVMQGLKYWNAPPQKTIPTERSPSLNVPSSNNERKSSEQSDSSRSTTSTTNKLTNSIAMKNRQHEEAAFRKIDAHLIKILPYISSSRRERYSTLSVTSENFDSFSDMGEDEILSIRANTSIEEDSGSVKESVTPVELNETESLSGDHV
eukprot:Nk52_evm61s554 gene=Nk52_evmTU61s554